MPPHPLTNIMKMDLNLMVFFPENVYLKKDEPYIIDRDVLNQ